MQHARFRAVAAAMTVLAWTGVAAAFTDDFSAPLSAAWNPPRTEEPGSSVTSPFVDARASDGQVVELLFPGGTASDHSGPAYATELQTVASGGFGVYEARLRTPKGSRMTGLVSGFFTYFNDGLDHDLDGIADNHEIDFEFLAAEPTVIYLSVWTEYESDGPTESFRKTTRKIDLRSGRVWQTPDGGEDQYELVEVEPLPFRLKKFRHARAYATYRFDWQSDRVEYSIDVGDGEGFRTLWTLTGAADETIPSIEAPLFFNVWHNATHWHSGATARVPGRDMGLRVDGLTIP
jgi:hypothetical protein